MGDVEMQQCFLGCSAQMKDVTKDMKTKIWRDLVSKTYHARIGVITDRFGDDATWRYSAKTKNDSLRMELKMKSRAKSIVRVEVPR